MEELYEILEQVGYFFRLKLPESIRIYPVFYIEKLYKDPGNPLPGQANPEPPLLELQDGETEYKVQKILVVKLLYRKLKYRI
jgi:hypothetical protein